jgi:hypothetical protein
VTSKTSSQIYLQWHQVIEKLPAKWRGIFSDSSARLVRIQDSGYLVDINGFDAEKLSAVIDADGFKSTLGKLVIPWAWNHPAGRGRKCWGISFGNDISSCPILVKKTGRLEKIKPRRLKCTSTLTS